MATNTRQLIDNAEARCEVTNQTDAQWTVWVNDGRQRLRDILVRTDQSYFESTDTTQTTVASQEDYDLKSDFLRLLAIEVQDSEGDWRSLQPYRHGDRNVLRNTPDPYVNIYGPQFYQLKGTKVRLLPPPTEAGRTIRMRYVAVPTAMKSPDAVGYDGSTPGSTDILIGIEEYFKEYIEIWAALQARTKLEGETLPLERMLTRARERIMQSAPQRDSNHPRVLGSVSGYGFQFDPWSW